MDEVTIGLGGAWNPRGELSRLVAHLPAMTEVYSGIALVIPPDTEQEILDSLNSLSGLQIVIADEWSWGRHLALQSALDFPVTTIQYADMDRLLRWIETRPEEWRTSVMTMPGTECIVFGRTERAYLTHPKAILRTEAISNRVFSKLLGQPLDLSAGSKGFSREACEYLVAHSRPGRALGMDAQWPVLLHGAGYQIEMVWVEGLDWESADRYRKSAAGAEDQKQAAEVYDQNPANWAYRVEVAMEIVSAGLEVMGVFDR